MISFKVNSKGCSVTFCTIIFLLHGYELCDCICVNYDSVRNDKRIFFNIFVTWLYFTLFLTQNFLHILKFLHEFANFQIKLPQNRRVNETCTWNFFTFLVNFIPQNLGRVISSCEKVQHFRTVISCPLCYVAGQFPSELFCEIARTGKA